MMIINRAEADKIYQLLSKSDEKTLSIFQKDSYSSKLMKLVDILKDDIKDNYYVLNNDVEFTDVFELKSIKDTYSLLKSLEIYSNAKEV